MGWGEREDGGGGGHNVFYNLIQESTYHHFCPILLATQTNPDNMWEETIQEINTRK